jgi:hypothetical protein
MQLDQGTPQVAPIPPRGLCPPTSAGGPDECYCCSCGEQRPVRRSESVVTAAGRPGKISPCPVCGSDRIRLGGRLSAYAEPVQLPHFRTPDRPGKGGPALVVRTRVDAPITDIPGIGASRAAALAALGIRDVVALADADVHVVATLPSVSDPIAAALIASAVELVRARGERVVDSFL